MRRITEREQLPKLQVGDLFYLKVFDTYVINEVVKVEPIRFKNCSPKLQAKRVYYQDLFFISEADLHLYLLGFGDSEYYPIYFVTKEERPLFELLYL